MKIDRAALGKKNKAKGSVGERHFRDEFRDIGYDKCVTSRLGSRLHDNVGADLIFLPYNVQIKVGIQSGLNVRRELQSMTEKMLDTFPEDSVEFGYPRLVIHKRAVEPGKKKTDFDSIVSMPFSDFKKLAIELKNCKNKKGK